MPEISIIIMMYFDEHNPPHFHVKYNEHAAVFNIRTLNILLGTCLQECAVWWRSGRSYTSKS